MSRAREGAASLVAHLKSTGTGESKLAIAQAAAEKADGDSERAGAMHVVSSLAEQLGDGHGTVTKARSFAETLPEAPARKTAPVPQPDAPATADDPAPQQQQPRSPQTRLRA